MYAPAHVPLRPAVHPSAAAAAVAAPFEQRRLSRAGSLFQPSCVAAPRPCNGGYSVLADTRLPSKESTPSLYRSNDTSSGSSYRGSGYRSGYGYDYPQSGGVTSLYRQYTTSRLGSYYSSLGSTPVADRSTDRAYTQPTDSRNTSFSDLDQSFYVEPAPKKRRRQLRRNGNVSTLKQDPDFNERFPFLAGGRLYANRTGKLYCVDE